MMAPTISISMRGAFAACVAGALMLVLGGCATPPPAASPAPEEPAKKAQAAEPAPTGPIAPLAWLAGCWQGNVNQRDLREQWLPLRGGMLVGAGQQTSGGKMQDYEYLRIEQRVNGIFFSQFSGDRKETSFRLVSTTTEDKDTIFTFASTSPGFPARLIYRRGADGWLYETIEGSLNGADKRVIYPLRRVSCETGELLLK
jgi:hypothetical protein